MTRKLVPAGLMALASLAAASCAVDSSGEDGDDGSLSPADSEVRQAGALVDVKLKSRVAVVLDEIPKAQREKLARFYLGKPSAFWVERAKQQLRHTNYRLTYRNFFYDESEQRNMLALPPEEVWEIKLSGAPRRVKTRDGHDAVEVSYTFHSLIVTDSRSPGASDPALRKTGGVWEEPFNFPLDPEFLFQRTGYACADEDGYPLGTAESENIAELFDQDCDVETEDTASCHLSELPEESCLDALAAHVGRVDTVLRFERIAFSEQKAAPARVGKFTTKDRPDLAVIQSDLKHNWLEYRYVPADSCAIVEQCVGGPGWRRLLLFDATIKNTGAAALTVGSTEEGSPPRDHNMFEFSECHEHFHFRHYGDFSYGNLPGDKRAFCVESTDRHFNNEGTPLVHEFGCEAQGVAPGWGDTYIAGVECNWIDITDLPVPAQGLTQNLKFVVNPDKFLCEGEPQLSSAGEPLYESTGYVTETGLPVDRPVCDFNSGYAANNVGKQAVPVPQAGGLVTSACTRDQAGPLRDCGLRKQREHVECEAGSEVKLSCRIPDGRATQVVRVCDDSAQLGGIPCMYREALVNGIVGSKRATLSFTCPEARDANEPGGTFSLYVGSVDPSEAASNVYCHVE